MLPVGQDAPVDHVVQTGTSLQRPGAWHVPDIAAMLSPLVAELSDARQVIERQAETIGRLQAELQQRDEQIRALQAPSPEPEPTSPAADAVGTPRTRPSLVALPVALALDGVDCIAGRDGGDQLLWWGGATSPLIPRGGRGTSGCCLGRSAHRYMIKNTPRPIDNMRVRPNHGTPALAASVGSSPSQ